MLDFSKLKYLIVPDVHGRDFWFKAVDDALANNVHVVFLGDYLDPYEYEGIMTEQAISYFEDIINLKKEHPEQITLLIGNHDMHYINGSRRGCRMDYEHKPEIVKMFSDNKDLFEYAKFVTVNDKNFIFSHAGFLPSWIALYCDDLGVDIPDDDFRDQIDNFQKNIDFDFLKKFDWTEFSNEYKWMNRYSSASHSRGGDSPHGSILWADVSEHILEKNKIRNCAQIFGHTQQEEFPVREGNNIYCLDCRKVFGLTTEGNIVNENMEELPDNGKEILDRYLERIKKMSFFF